MPRWSVYLVRCRGGSLYTGITTDVSRRLSQHVRGGGRGAKYLRGKGPLQLVFKQAIGRKGLALRVEARIKRLPKRRKERLLEEGHLIGEILARAGSGTRRIECNRRRS
jgi:putative endonuclease